MDDWRPVRRRLFELLSLSGMLTDQSWTEILKRRDMYREAFACFDPSAVARMEEDDVAEISGNRELMVGKHRYHKYVPFRTPRSEAVSRPPAAPTRRPRHRLLLHVGRRHGRRSPRRLVPRLRPPRRPLPAGASPTSPRSPPGSTGMSSDMQHTQTTMRHHDSAFLQAYLSCSQEVALGL